VIQPAMMQRILNLVEAENTDSVQFFIFSGLLAVAPLLHGLFEVSAMRLFFHYAVKV
jgi:hypothetical protein